MYSVLRRKQYSSTIHQKVPSHHLLRAGRVLLYDTTFLALVNDNHLVAWDWCENFDMITILCRLQLPSMEDKGLHFYLLNDNVSQGPTDIRDGHGLINIRMRNSRLSAFMVVDRRILADAIKSMQDCQQHRQPFTVPWSQWSFSCRLCTGVACAVYGYRVLISRERAYRQRADPERTQTWSVLEFSFLKRDIDHSHARLVNATDVFATDYMANSPWKKMQWGGRALECIESTADGPPCPENATVYIDAQRLVIIPVGEFYQYSIFISRVFRSVKGRVRCTTFSKPATFCSALGACKWSRVARDCNLQYSKTRAIPPFALDVQIYKIFSLCCSAINDAVAVIILSLSGNKPTRAMVPVTTRLNG